ncbi:MAG: putative fatty acid desaturase protein [Alphaproteobacteria bacterium]|nr:putative fatty acid desaturase protein [Alphaproteobacteria bacterium]
MMIFIDHWGWVTFGECGHNNHHAFPGSARLGVHAHQSDPGWWMISTLKKPGLAWNVNQPEDLPLRPELITLKPQA